MAPRPEFYYDARTQRYRKRVRLAPGVYRDVWGKSKEETRQRVRSLLDAHSQGLALDDRTTVAELAAQWYADRRDQWSYSRRSDHAGAINNHICPVLGSMELRQVRPEHCQRVLTEMAGLSYSMQSKTVGVLKQLFACAEENGLILRSPCAGLRPGGERPREKTPLTPEQCETLEAAVRGTRAYPLVMLGLYAGLRREEICGLRWQDVELEADPPRLTVNHALRLEGTQARFPAPLKTRAAHRTIPLPPRLAAALRELRAASASDFVVPAADGGHATAQTVKNLSALLRRRQTPAQGDQPRRGPQIPRTLDFPVTPHLLRHTYITRLCEGGMDVKKIQYLAGHSDVKMTLGVYAHVVNNRPEDLIGPVSQVFH